MVTSWEQRVREDERQRVLAEQEEARRQAAVQREANLERTVARMSTANRWAATGDAEHPIDPTDFGVHPDTRGVATTATPEVAATGVNIDSTRRPGRIARLRAAWSAPQVPQGHPARS